MNSKIRTLALAAPLAAAALTLAPGVAHAETPAPKPGLVIVTPPSDPGPKGPGDIAVPDPEPQPPKGPGDIKVPAPKPEPPKGPGDISNPEPEPTHPDGPGDLTNPEPEPTHPDGPGDLTNPAPCPTHGVDCTDGDDVPSDDGGTDTDVDAPQGGVQPTDVTTPTRVDAGLAGAESSDGLNLAWVMAGGLLVTATGAGVAARKRFRTNL